MSASSVSGTGPGPANKANLTELANVANGPHIIFSGYTEVGEGVASPPDPANSVRFPYSLPGGSNNYVVMLTTQNSGSAYVSNMVEDENDDFIGFDLVAETEGTVMYLVTKVGIRPLA